ncbi:MAG: selenide, water dikinase SelD [Chthonomonas sp.]|nr:selenide, water dikinase SelD [Chthonomonas sp.]
MKSGGCASKLGQAQLAEVLRHLPRTPDPRLLVGFDTSDDAGAILLPDGRVMIQTTDFFTPIVDDAYDFGRIAATNALSDSYAMGATPLTALNIALFDPAIVPPEVWAEVSRGAFDQCTKAGVIVMGGHTVVDAEPKFGLAVTGFCDSPQQLFRNDAAAIGDDIYLTKPLGTGMITTAAKRGACPPEVLARGVDVMTTLNADAMHAAHAAGVRCATDITGFGLAGHLLNVARASEVCIELDGASLPEIEGCQDLHGYCPAGAGRNQAHAATLMKGEIENPLLYDPQTSGGLALFSRQPIHGAIKIGRVTGPGATLVVG